ncbi:hypothetical protein [Devosia sp. SD17-2]|uniref:hypothetical protein n=1 Tax=Devosia sp. SD17-2 TaxID=2976459 RepID=UPI0023D8A6CB|nr:hypothetical protein [Devosia sp. SD17-2]WEJ32357.1 hypothetical protein NYQ88_15875 [Devosia sp. SD17-2]
MFTDYLGGVMVDVPFDKRLLNAEWQFAYGDLRDVTDPDDPRWYDVGLPHSFGIPYFMDTQFYVGKGTYSRQIDVAPSEIGMFHALEFMGVFQDALVLVNGIEAGRHLGG